MSPQQEIFTKIRPDLIAKGDDVYDSGLPPDGTPYPFIYLGEARQTDDLRFKGSMLANVFQDVHVWHSSPKKRGSLSAIMSDIHAVCAGIEDTPSFSWQFRGTETQVLTDNTTKTPLIHGIVTAEFHMTGGV